MYDDQSKAEAFANTLERESRINYHVDEDENHGRFINREGHRIRNIQDLREVNNFTSPVEVKKIIR